MGNCLLTKLKEVVDNDSLPVYNEVELLCDVSNPSSAILGVAAEESNSVKVLIDGGVLSTTPTGKISDTSYWAKNQIAGSGVKITPNSGSRYKIKIQGYYKAINLSMQSGCMAVIKNNVYYSPLEVLCLDFKEFTAEDEDNILPFNLDEMSDILKQNIRVLSIDSNNNAIFKPYIRGNISALSECSNLEKVILINTNLEGDISSLSDLTNLEEIQITKVAGVHGVIDSLGKLTGLTYIYFQGCNLSGNLEDLVHKQRGNGRTETTGTDTGISCGYGIGDNVYFNGNKVGLKGSRVLTWTPTTITFDGVTINDDIVTV